ncbi:MAG: carbohydrate-binding family 6 protein [bacterium]|nr:carbohydrate-binding family 6 protein [bacterium]
MSTDADGAMYGGLDLAEAITIGTLGEIRDSDHTPYIERRGIKFNIPLDARTPSYSDNADAAQNNIPEMWSFDFWREALDELARQRFNVLTLWSLHPFPSMVKVPEYPDVALDDVMRTTLPMDETFSHSGRDMVRPDMLEHLETVKTMSIDEKIQFWREVMQYAHDRGIEVYIFTWNIFTFGAEGKYGITPDQNNQATADYFRATIREMVLTYPLLDGFGITAGENMRGNNPGGPSKEEWLWAAYGEGVRDAKKLLPNRRVRLIHRYHQTAQSEITEEWKDYPDTFDLSFKYAIAHMYSIPNPPYIKDALPYLSPDLRTWLTVRDDDYYTFRWGDPEYARAFIRHMPGKDKVVGYYMGPDGYIWGREFLSKEPDAPRKTVFSKRWYNFMLWGRLSYDPDLPDALFQRTLAARFPEVPADKLFAAWAQASKIFPLVTRFFWGTIDLRWFPEACLSHPKVKGFYTVKHFVEGGDPLPERGVLDIVEWRGRKLAGETMPAATPIEIAEQIEAAAGEALKLVSEFRQNAGENKELRLTIGDLTAMAHLGNYYAAKIRGAADLGLFDKTSDVAQRDSAVKHLHNAYLHWKLYARAYTAQYRQPVLYNRVGWVDIPALSQKVEEDIGIAKLWTPGTVPDERQETRRSNPAFKK